MRKTSPKDPAPITLMGLYLCYLSSFQTSQNFIFSLIIADGIVNKFIIMAEPFRKDRHSWTTAQCDQVQYTLRCNQFFSPIFQSRYMTQILDMCYYCKIMNNEPINLKDNKKPVAIILLSGHIAVYKKQLTIKHSPRKNNKDAIHKEFIKLKELHTFNQTITPSSQCKILSLHAAHSECLFIPSFMYNQYIQRRQQEKDQIMCNMLNTIFKVTEKKPIIELAKAGCLIKQLRFNNYVYHQADKPQSVFIILEGSAKIQQPGFSYKASNMVVVSTNSILGDKDLLLPQRQTSVVCCSAYLRLLQIPKNPFLKFARNYLPNFKEPSLSPLKKSEKSIGHKKRKSMGDADVKLPSIFRVYSATKTKEEEERQYNLIKNSHILLDASSPRKNKIRVRSSVSDKPLDIMKEKVKFYKKLRPNQPKIDLNHRIV